VDKNIKCPHHPSKNSGASCGVSQIPTGPHSVFFSTFRVFLRPKIIIFSRRHHAFLRGPFRVAKVLHTKHFLSMSWILYSPVDAPRAHEVIPPFQGRAQQDAADIRRSSPKTAPRPPAKATTRSTFAFAIVHTRTRAYRLRKCRRVGHVAGEVHTIEAIVPRDLRTRTDARTGKTPPYNFSIFQSLPAAAILRVCYL
jgi:hypothetical protein